MFVDDVGDEPCNYPYHEDVLEHGTGFSHIEHVEDEVGDDRDEDTHQ